ncbi:hypothetical protein ILUMI_13391 [Ignelater luminosus]|uniref:Uncharacterized protein n=1 Tax=Ignelater luminosus TaxID=2038154 RepID=A0A8K0G8Q0_IGNLU|nr:hypothetical protein ILUMI_13391 [Ignelater luminosus]
MKITIFLILWFSTIVSAHQTYCKDETKSFDCGTKGSPYYYRDHKGVCHFGCKNGERILNCKQVHPPPNLPEYWTDDVCCQKKTFDCGNKGDPQWFYFNDECQFFCLVEGDLLFTCEQIYFTPYVI